MSDHGHEDPLRGVVREAMAFEAKHTVLLGLYEGDAFKHNASGIVLEVGGVPFLLTARHVALAALDTLDLWVSVPPDAGEPIQLDDPDRAFLSSAPNADVALFRLNAEERSKLEPAYGVLPSESLATDLAPAVHDRIHVLGFGEGELRVDDGSRSGGLVSYVGGVAPPPAGWTPPAARRELFVSYEPDVAYTSGGSAEGSGFDIVERPSPGGMSGCGMWWLGGEDADYANWSPGDLRLVAVQAKFAQSHDLLFGTHVRMVIRLAYESAASEAQERMADRWTWLRSE